jgi:hypothetical protein
MIQLKNQLTPASRAVRVINLSNISQPDLILIAELSVFVRVSIALTTLSLSSETVPKECCLIYSKRVLMAATDGEMSLSFINISLKYSVRSLN